MGNDPFIQVVEHSISLGIGALFFLYQPVCGVVVLTEKILINPRIVFDAGGAGRKEEKPQKKKGKLYWSYSPICHHDLYL
jgi:hypothetical protein